VGCEGFCARALPRNVSLKVFVHGFGPFNRAHTRIAGWFVACVEMLRSYVETGSSRVHVKKKVLVGYVYAFVLSFVVSPFLFSLFSILFQLLYFFLLLYFCFLSFLFL
jgi:hypothetical protein